jgi:hypothetical protein
MDDLADALDAITVKTRDAHSFGGRLHHALRLRQKSIGACPLVGVSIYSAEYEVMSYVMVHLGREPIGVSYVNSEGHFKNISDAVWRSGFVPISGQFFRSGDVCFFLAESDKLANLDISEIVAGVMDCYSSCLTMQMKMVEY